MTGDRIADMAYLDWMKRSAGQPARMKPDATPDVLPSRKGNPITPLSRSEWRPDNRGLCELRQHIGKSVEGFHGGLEVSYGRAEGTFKWGSARLTAEAAQKSGDRMRAAWERADMSRNFPARQNDKLFAEWRQDYRLAKQRDETGREPKSTAQELLPASKPEPSKQRPRRERLKAHDIPF